MLFKGRGEKRESMRSLINRRRPTVILNMSWDTKLALFAKRKEAEFQSIVVLLNAFRGECLMQLKAWEQMS